MVHGGPCGQCWPWTLPLMMDAQDINGTTVPLRYEQWLLFHLHVVLHQAGHWPGELNQS